jgi:hypothetical protein
MKNLAKTFVDQGMQNYKEYMIAHDLYLQFGIQNLDKITVAKHIFEYLFKYLPEIFKVVSSEL